MTYECILFTLTDFFPILLFGLFIFKCCRASKNQECWCSVQRLFIYHVHVSRTPVHRARLIKLAGLGARSFCVDANVHTQCYVCVDHIDHHYCATDVLCVCIRFIYSAKLCYVFIIYSQRIYTY
jgi:hypothetical protein